jgi:hypothetical protein
MDNMGGSMVPGNEIPAHHPVRELFLTLTDRGLRESKVSDEEIHRYLSNLLVEFVHMENMYKVRDESGQRVEYLTDMLGCAEGAGSIERSDIYKRATMQPRAAVLTKFFPNDRTIVPA